MATDAISGLDYPANTAAPSGAAQLMALALSGRGKTIRTAADEADRDAKYGAGSATTAPDGMIVVAPAVPAVWMKLPDRWSVLFQGPRPYVPQLQDMAGVAKSGNPNEPACWYSISNDVVTAHGEVGVNENIDNVLITLPVTAAQRQIGIGIAGIYGGSSQPSDQTGLGYMADTGRLAITAYTQGYRDAVAGNTIRFLVTYSLL